MSGGRDQAARRSFEVLGGEILARDLAQVGVHVTGVDRPPAAVGREVLEELLARQLLAVAHDTGAPVLVVDDHADSRDLIAFMLTGGGHEARVAADADEALELGEYPHIKLVAGSAGWDASGQTASQWSLEVLARAAGAEGALPKPLIPEALLALVDGLVDGAPLAQR